jgi:hypothetical protein
VEELGKLGVTWLVLRLPGETLPELLDEIGRLGHEVISRA